MSSILRSWSVVTCLMSKPIKLDFYRFLILQRSQMIDSLPSYISWNLGAHGKVYNGQIMSLDQPVNMWPSGNVVCPANSNCGVMVTIPLWNISGFQTIESSCEIPSTNTSYYQKMYGLSYLDTTGPPYGNLDGHACPGHSSSQFPEASVCFLPGSLKRSNTSMLDCPSGPSYNASNPFLESL